MAVWFAAMMLASTLVLAVAPTAIAAHTSAQALNSSMLIDRTGVTTGYVPYSASTHGALRPDDKISIWWNLTWTDNACETGSSVPTLPGNQGGHALSKWDLATTTTANIGLDASLVGGANPAGLTVTNVSAETGGAIKYRAVYGNVTVGPSGLEGASQRMTLSYTLTCGVNVVRAANDQPAPTDANSAQSPAFNLDTKAPTIEQLAPGAWDYATASALNLSNGIAGIGVKVPLKIRVTDGFSALNATPVHIFDGAITGATAGVSLASEATHTITISSAAPTPVLDGSAPVNVIITAKDALGNTATATIPVRVDNRLPTPADFFLHKANLTRDVSGSTLDLHWSGSVPRAAVRVATQTATTPVVIATPSTSPANGIAVPIVNDLTDWVSLEVFPLDNGGNVNLDPALRRSPTWVQNITTQLATTPGVPAVLGGNAIRNVYVNVSSPSDVPWPSAYPTALTIFGELVRETGSGGIQFWQNNTAGSSLANDFQSAESLNTADFDDNDNVLATAFQPAYSASATNAFVFTNLTATSPARNFVDGNYQLWMNLSSADGNRTRYVYRFVVDSFDPDLNTLSNNTAKGVPTAVSRDVHGTDRNPLRVAINATDWRANADGGNTGIRNVTVELVDTTLANVAPNTSSTTGAVARVDITPASCWSYLESDASRNAAGSLPYCYDLTGWTPATFATRCTGASNTWAAHCLVYQNVTGQTGVANSLLGQDRLAAFTWINESMFEGYVNTTFPDLPAGRYVVRVLAYDDAGRVKVDRFGSTDTDLYKVAPSVRLSTENFPRLTEDNRLEMIVYTAQRYANPPFEVVDTCAAESTTKTNLCAARSVTLTLSNSATGAGTTYPYLTVSSFSPNARTFEDVLGAYSRDANTGALIHSRGKATMFPNVTINTPVIPASSGLNLANPLYLRAEVVETLADGTTVRNATEWVRVLAAGAPPFDITSPSRDWTLNRTTDRPPLVVSLERREAGAAAATLSYHIFPASTPFDLDAVTTTIAPLVSVHNVSATRTVPTSTNTTFHWNARLENGANSLPAGDYRVNVIAYETGTGRELGSTSRLFSIADAATIPAPTLAGSPGVNVRSGINYVLRTFEVPFTVNHGSANLTSTDQIVLRLRPSAGSGTTELARGEQGFDYAVFTESPVGEEISQTSFRARVTLPTGLTNGDTFTVNVTAKLDLQPPHGFGDATRLVPVTFDATPGEGWLAVRSTETSVLDVNANPAADLASPDPKFLGIAKDLGAGIAKIEVRIRDMTTNQTIQLRHTSPGYGLFPVDNAEDGWSDSTLTNGVRIVDFDTTTTTGEKAWFIKLRNRGGTLPDLWTANDPNSLFQLSHTYRVEVRVTDALGQRGAINTTLVDFDGAAPYLGYNGALGVPSTTKSGITASSVTVPWHESATLSVRVSDNQCVKEVWLLGVSDKSPNTVVRAQMTASANTNAVGATRVCRSGMTGTGANAPYVTYSIDLKNAPHMTDEVTNYTYWWLAVDDAGQTSEVASGSRTFRMQVLDNTPAEVRRIFFTPHPAQVGGRALVRADVFENMNVSHVQVTVHDLNNEHNIVARGSMHAENETSKGWTRYVADTQTDLNMTLELRSYLVNVTAYDVNWNRSAAQGGPTCPFICFRSTEIFIVRDDGNASVALESPRAGAVLNATPSLKFRAQHKLLETSGVTVRVTTDGNESNLATLPAAALNFTELKAPNGTRQGYDIVYTPATALADNATLIINVSVNVNGLIASEQHTFRVDAAAPTVVSNVTNTRPLGGKTYALTTTRVELTANDTVSTPTIVYTVNGAATETTYSGPITPALSGSATEGDWRLEFWARDAAGNQAPKQTVTLAIDRQGPRISVSGHGDEVLLLLNDTGVGVNNTSVTVHYRYGNGTSYTPITATQVAGGNSYRAVLPGNATTTGLAYYFTAQDALGNQGTNYSATSPYVIPRAGTDPGPGPGPDPENEPPTLVITAPVTGQTVTGSVDIRWTATDPEQAPVTIIIARKSPDQVVMPPAPDPGRYTLNLSTIPAGSLTLVITASDGENEVTEEVQVNVAPAETITAKPLPRVPVQAGVGIPIEVTITPVDTTVSRATYSLVRNGTTIPGGPLTRTAAGTYAAVISANQSGTYAVVVDVVYADQSTESRNVGSFAVAAPVAPPITEPTTPAFPVSLMVLAALAVLTVALAAYGAFGRWRK